MGLAVLVFSLVVGFFHFQGDAGQPSNAEMLADTPDVPAGPTDWRQASPRPLSIRWTRKIPVNWHSGWPT